MSRDELIDDLMKDVELVIDMHRNPNFKHGLMTRIRGAAEALCGIDKPADAGPWTASSDGRILSSDDFEHDVQLKVGGDFYSDEQRVAYSNGLCRKLNGLPKDPPPGLLESMAMRYRHDFGLDRDPDQTIGSGFTEDERQSLLRDMRKIYEEVAGTGFYRWS